MTSSKSSTSIDSLQLLKTKGLKKSEESLSMVVKAEPVQTNAENEKKILVYKSLFNLDREEMGFGSKPDDFVYLHFIKNDMKKNLLHLSNKSSYLHLNLVWRVKFN